MAASSKQLLYLLARDLQFKRMQKHLASRMGRRNCLNHSTNHTKGTMIPFPPNLNFKIEKQITDKNGRYIILDWMFADARLVLVNIYAPNGVHQQVLFFKELQNQLKDYAEETIIIGGDFKVAQNSFQYFPRLRF